MDRYSASDNKFIIARGAPLLFVLLAGFGYALAFTPGPAGLIEHTRRSSIYPDETRGIENLTAAANDFTLDDESAGDIDTRFSSALFITLFAGLITFIRPGFNEGTLEGSVNSFLYESAFGYSPLRSPPSV